MRKQIALGTLIALGLGGQAWAADGLSYNLLEGGYAHGEVKDLDIKGDGFSLAGSMEIAPHVFGLANYTNLDMDGGVTTSQFSLGIGYNITVAPNLDLLSGVTYENVKVDISGLGSASDAGYGLAVGLRGRAADRLELTGMVKYVNVGHGNDDTTLSANARYYVTDAFAIGPDISHNSDGTTWGFSLRYDFGRRF